MGVTCCSVRGAAFISEVGTWDKGGGCLGLGGVPGAAWQRVTPCWRAGLALPWELAGHVGLSWEQPGAERRAELCRQLPAWVAVGKGLGCPALLRCRGLPWCRKHGFGTAAIKSKPHTFPQSS